MGTDDIGYDMRYDTQKSLVAVIDVLCDIGEYILAVWIFVDPGHHVAVDDVVNLPPKMGVLVRFKQLAGSSVCGYSIKHNPQIHTES